MLNMKLRLLCKRYIENNEGAFSLAWAVSLTTILFAVGATYDVAQLSSAKLKSQSLADNIALAAAIHVKQNKGLNPSIPVTDGLETSNNSAFYEGVTYTAEDAGYDFSGMIDGGTKGVTFEVDYDDVLRQAKVTVYGKIKPAFLQVTGKDTLPFKSVSIVKYHEEGIANSASVFLVLDNSGSMAFMDSVNIPNASNGARPPTAAPRINGLKSSVNSFIDQLTEVNEANSDSSRKVLRMAMYPYSSNNYIKPHVEANWKIIDKSAVNRMNASGGTAPQQALKKAQDRLLKSNSSISESKIHEEASGVSDPFRFLVYMTDGQNSGDLSIWTPRNDTDYWRIMETKTETKTRQEWVQVTRMEPASCFYYHYNRYGQLKNHGNRKRHYYDGYYCNPAREVKVWEYQTVEYEETTQDWVYHAGTTPPDGRNWQEGVFDSKENQQVRTLCKTMKDDGVEIFTVAYSLDPGWYNTGSWGSGGSYETSESQSRIAKLLMKDCASNEKNFLDAIDTTALKEAFELIGEKIVADSLRIRS